MMQSPDGPITRLPNTPDWRGRQCEARALYQRVLTHLARRVSETKLNGRLLEARDAARTLCLVQHVWHGQFPCMVCRSWIGPRLIAQLEAKALATTGEHR